MKTRTKLFIALAIVLALIAGFFLGTMVNLPPADKSNLSGTIAKVNNYRNVKISENDIKLRSELLDNEELCLQLQRYFTFHYAFNLQLATNVDLALKAANAVQIFSEKYGNEIKSLTGVNTYLNEVRKDFLLVVVALQQIKETDQQNIGMLINNAYNAVIQTGDRNQTVVQFTDAILEFFKTEAMVNYPDLLKAHDALLINLVRNSAATGDKMMIKFLDKKEFLGSKENIQSSAFCDKSFLNNAAMADISGLENMISLSDKQFLSNLFTFSDKQSLENSQSISDKAALNSQAAADKQALSSQAVNDKQALGNQAVADKQALESQAIADKQALESQAVSDKQALSSSQLISDKGTLQSQSLFSAEALNMLFLTDVSQFLSSQKGDLGSKFIFDAHALESSGIFSDKENLSARFIGSAATLGSVMNPDNLSLFFR